MSCIVINNKIKKINNIFLEELLTFQIKRFLLKILKDFKESKKITERTYLFHKEEIEIIFKNICHGLVDKIKFILTNINISNIYHFVPDDNFNNYNNYEDFIRYYENNNIEYIYELFGFYDKNTLKNNEIEKIYSDRGGFIVAFELWELNEKKKIEKKNKCINNINSSSNNIILNTHDNTFSENSFLKKDLNKFLEINLDFNNISENHIQKL